MASIFGSGNRKDPWMKKCSEWIEHILTNFIKAGTNISITEDTTNHQLTINSTGGSSVEELDDLDDVSITNPSNGQAMIYDSAKDLWKNANLPTPAEQVQSDWNQADNTKKDFIKNKPTIPDELADLSDDSTHRLVTDTQITQWNAAEANVQSDWNQSTTTADDFIKNKPTLGTAAAKNVGVANGVAELDSDGKVPSSQLPSFVDDVIEVANYASLPATGEGGKIYITKDDNKTYRWSGTGYVEISPSLALGETSSTAYYGDKGKTAYDHSQLISGNPHNVTKTDIGLWNVPNVTTNNQTPTFTEASTRSNIASGETLATIFGKIKKFFTDLKAVAFSGSYNDLSDQPTIPTVNDGTLTITQNGTSKGTFTANQSENSTIALTDTTYSVATTSANGLMSSTDKSKLDTLTQDFRGIVTVETADSFVAGWRRFAKITASGNYGSALLAFRGRWTNNAPYVGTVLYTIRYDEAKLRILDGFGQPNNVHQKLRAVRISANNYYLEMYRSATSNANNAQYCDIVPISGTQNWTVTETSDTPPINNNATGANDYEISLMDEQFMPYQTNTGYIGTSDKAWKEGYINNLHGDVDGSATKLTKTETVLQTNQVPYVSRASLSPEGFSGYIREKIVGGSVSWNQLFTVNSGIGTASGTTISQNTDGSYHIAVNGTPANYHFAQTASNPLLPNHKYLVMVKGLKTGVTAQVYLYGSGVTTQYLYSSGTDKNQIITIPASTTGFTGLYARFYTGSTFSGTTDIYFILTDLTQFFSSSAIADYIYSLESSTAGAGVSLLRSLGLFTKPYYAQDNGSIQSVCVKEKKIVGFNQWDEEWEVGRLVANTLNAKNHISVIGGMTYYFYNSSNCAFQVYEYDSNKTITLITIINVGTFTLQQNTKYIRFRMSTPYGTTYSNDICVNISDTTKNGTYEPYHLDTIPLSATDLRGIPKLDASNNLYFDGDEYTSDGKIKRRYILVDLGAQNWTKSSSNSNAFFTDVLSTIKKPATTAELANFLIPKYVSVSQDNYTYADKTCCIATSGRINICDTNYTDAATFTTAMNGVYAVCEAATPTEETALSYQNPQYAKDGTEEFVDGNTRDVAIPVGHVTEYMGATAGEYQFMPTMPVDEGKYVLTADKHEVVWEKKEKPWKKQGYLWTKQSGDSGGGGFLADDLDKYSEFAFACSISDGATNRCFFLEVSDEKLKYINDVSNNVTYTLALDNVVAKYLNVRKATGVIYFNIVFVEGTTVPLNCTIKLQLYLR